MLEEPARPGALGTRRQGQNWKRLSGPGEGTDLSLLFVWVFIILYFFFSSLIFLNKSKIRESGVCKPRVQGTYLVVFRRRGHRGNVLLGLLMSATGQRALQREG